MRAAGCRPSAGLGWGWAPCASAPPIWADSVPSSLGRPAARACWRACPLGDRMETIRVLIADDHPVFRFGLRALLSATPGLEVAGEARGGEEAVALAASRQPDAGGMGLNEHDP